MGRHSRRDPADLFDDTASAAGPGAGEAGARPAPRPGTGRRRRDGGPGAQDTGEFPAQGGPGGAAPPPAPAVRGGHPEQREPGGGWGAPHPTPPTHGTAKVPHQRGPRDTGPQPANPGMLGTPLAAGRTPGPRQEYLDAFADGPSPPGPQGSPYGPDAAGDAPRPTGRSVVFEREGDAPDDDGYAEDGEELVPEEPAGGADRRKGTKGRTFTGVAAAAVTTVLAVVVAGQVADARKHDSETQRGGGDRSPSADDASRTQSRPTTTAPTYAEKMAKAYPLAAELKGPGTFKAVGGDAAAPGDGRVVRYRVDVEDGLSLDGELFAEAVHKTLNDERSWAHGGQRAFQRVASGDADFVITLASPGTTDEWCAKSGLDTSQDKVSCDSAATDRVMINAYRWARGAQTYGPDKMYSYRQMLINHEVGHRLGHDHEYCGRQGALAPVMMQQTKFLTTDGVTCRPNAWPYPSR